MTPSVERDHTPFVTIERVRIDDVYSLPPPPLVWERVEDCDCSCHVRFLVEHGASECECRSESCE